MGAIDALWHGLNFLAPAFGLGLLSAAGMKLLWRRELAAVAWRRLALWACSAAGLALIAGLVITGGDGRMSTYAAMVLACAIALGWAGFGPQPR